MKTVEELLGDDIRLGGGIKEQMRNLELVAERAREETIERIATKLDWMADHHPESENKLRLLAADIRNMPVRQ